ncbi:MAG: GDP-mannose 4,6-dehydratase [Alphaproteobacteria bacterium MarineAlpha5_Bin5]|nr:MAG: GDP-mannose 4,6-dehydratase [Alphaproteobacteria bacterium MarineAlpha5_Bin5]|tara:strand:+ start:5062 stop:6099 length:1038 start_codon:yes stop_codon:yes gene_type:complete
MKSAFITGITGQDGSYLAEFLLKKNYTVHGLKRRTSTFNTKRIDHIYQDPSISNRNLILHHGDLLDASSLNNIISKIKPDEIYNLAAQSHVAVSFEQPEYTANADALGTVRILEAIKNFNLIKKTKFYQASTSEMFGNISEKKLDENSIFKPISPYGVSKLFSYWITKNYRDSYGIFASNGILFNHESPRRGETFVTQKIVTALVKIKFNLQSCLYLGNLYAKRDWGHAKDYIVAIWKILQHKKADDFCIATGNNYSIKEFIEEVLKYLDIKIIWKGKGLSEVGINKKNNKIIIAIDKRYMRPNDINSLIGDSAKAKRELNWNPKVKFEELICEMVKLQIDIYKK